MVLHQPGAVHRGKTLGLKARQFDLGQTPGHATRCFTGRRRFAAGQRLGLGHHLSVLAGGDFVLADEVHHRLQRAAGVGLRQTRANAFFPLGRQVLEAELAVDKVTAIAGNERLLVARFAFAEGVAKVHLTVVQAALGQHVDVAEDHLAVARQRQADVVGQWLGVVQFIAGRLAVVLGLGAGHQAQGGDDQR